MTLQTKLFLVLVGLALLSGLWGYNQTTISAVEIFDKDQQLVRYSFTDEEVKLLHTSLQRHESPLQKPDQVTVDFTIKLKHALFGTSTYDLINMTDHSLMVREGNNYYDVKDKNTFYTAKAFESLYASSLPEAPHLTYGPVDGHISLLSSEWRIIKFDQQWHSATLDPVDAIPTFEVTSRESPLMLAFDLPPDHITLSYMNQSTQEIKMVSPTKAEDEYQWPLPEYDFEGYYTLTAYYTDASKPYEGTLNYGFTVNYDFPVALEIEKKTVVQGEPLHLLIQYANDTDDLTLHQDITTLPISLNQQETSYSAWLPTTYLTPPGSYTVSLGKSAISIDILPRPFNVQHLSIDKTIVSDTRSDAAYEEFDTLFDPVRLNSEPHDLTDGRFVLPVKGRLSTEYGETRDVNGSPTTYRHSGWDIAAPRGTEVRASNRGKVVFSSQLMLTGNTIVIDHGNGLFSTYFHLDTLTCQVGDLIEKSEPIGTVGTTGFSTGPHLHFIVSLWDQNLEPGYFIYGEAMTYKNYRTLMNP